MALRREIAVLDCMSIPLVCRETRLEGVARHLRRENHARFGAERHRKLTDEPVGLCRRERDRDRLAAILDDGTAAKSLRGSWALRVVLQNIESNLLPLGDELDRMTFHHDDFAAIVAFLGALGCR